MMTGEPNMEAHADAAIREDNGGGRILRRWNPTIFALALKQA